MRVDIPTRLLPLCTAASLLIPAMASGTPGARPNVLILVSRAIAQKHNLIDKHPEKAQELAEFLAQTRKQGHSAPRLSGGPAAE